MFGRRRSEAVSSGVVVATSRRWLAAALLIAVVFVALFGMASAEARVTEHTCEHVTCLTTFPSDAADGHDFTGHDACLHDSACGGGGALALSGLLFACVTAVALVPPRGGPSSRVASWLWDRGSTAEIVGGIERPPRSFA